MLVLSRKPGERILIGDNVTVTIVRIGPNNVRLGIDAPRDMNIVREELLADPQDAPSAAQSPQPSVESA
ncbi:MAG: carbon storage regulator [Planctomycetaceae bacterium]|jgi:carbon storage regulator|nr:carbon storage regulator [Planctomycetaceae bacterium]MBT6153079.1 carbon storage regulator [Planctomycetaceae bacterium]MBT6487934.1 carbon storage regulator [Planctomycetaceae bacterium]MBT6494517.1 carbon storage regulator [Planctomycetaceae bacterium]